MSIALPKSLTASAAIAALVAMPVLLAGCSGRDTVSAEQVAAANAAAERAEKAAERAEKAAAKAERPAAVQVDAEPEDVSDPAPDQNQPDPSAPTNHA